MIRYRQMGMRNLAAGAVTAMAVAAVLLQPSATTTAEAPAVRAVAAASDGCGELLAKADGSTWECTFVDEFEGKDLDESKWLVGETRFSGFHTGITCYVDHPRNVNVRRGALFLVTRQERPFTCESPTGDFETKYTGGHVTTRGRFNQTYGRFEVRAKYPDARNAGVHGGFWMYPNERTYGAWPNSGEIDVAEWWSSRPDSVIPSLHYPGRDFWKDSGWWCTVSNVSDWHTYSLEWTPREMRVYQDGELCWSRVWEPDEPLTAPQPFDHAFNMILLMGVGPASGNNAVTDDTELPGEYVVDYVKAWK